MVLSVCVCVKEQTMKKKLRWMEMMEKQPCCKGGEKRIACDEEEWREKKRLRGRRKVGDITNGMEIENYRKLEKLR